MPMLYVCWAQLNCAVLFGHKAGVHKSLDSFAKRDNLLGQQKETMRYSVAVVVLLF